MLTSSGAGPASASGTPGRDPDIGAVARRMAVMRRWSARCGIATSLLAAFVLVGWIVDAAWMRSWIPGESQTKFNGAIGLAAGGLGLALLARRRCPWVRRALGLLIAVIGVVTLVEYLAGVRLGVDELIVADRSSALGSNPGRIPPNAAVSLALCGWALATWRPARRRATIATWAGLGAAAIALVALVGYAAGVPAYLSVAGLTRIPLPTSIALLALGAGIALASPERGALALMARDGPGGAMTRRLIPVAVVVPPALSLLAWRGQVAGLYGTNVGILLLVSGLMAVMAAAIVFAARKLDSVDVRRRGSETELRLQSQITADLAEGVALVRQSDSKLIYVNRRMEEMLAVAPGGLAGATSDAIEYICADRAAQLAECRKSVRATGRWSDELEYVRADGTRFWGQVSISGFEHPDHGPLSISMISDVSEQHAAATALSRQVKLFDSVLRAAADHSIIGTDLEGTIVVFNAGAERMLGYTSAEAIGRQILLLIHDGAEIKARADELGLVPGLDVLVAAARHGQAETRDWTYVRADGSRLAVSLTVTGILGDGGEQTGFIGIATDVTEERAARAAQRVAEEQFRRSFDDALIGMMIFDLNARYIRVNDAFCEIVGHPREALLGMSRELITQADDLAPDAESLRALLAGETTSYTREKRYIHAAGHAVWVAVSVTLIHDSEGRPLHLIGQAQDITERRSYENQLQHMADHDPLTGLLNRRSFERELQSHIARVRRFGGAGAVLMIDLDNFKYYNDTQGHHAGDELIVLIAHQLRDRLRDTDAIARLGGDEFVVLLPREGRDQAETVARALLAHVREAAPSAKPGDSKRVTASIGIASFANQAPVTVEEMMIQADQALYQAKDAGRDGVAHYQADHQGRPRVDGQMKSATEISAALEDDRFELLAQPIRPLCGDGPVQYELLLRMRDPDGALIAPGAFLHNAERLGLIQEIDEWVTGRAISMLDEYRASGQDVRLAVNLSGNTIAGPGLLELIETRLNETGVAPDRLVFEITETAAVANVSRATVFADRLSELGCKFALDDFGAGLGSFYYLKHLPFDYLKIDGEFVRHCAESLTDRAIISAVVQIAHAMGKRTIAEFVEDQETVEILTGLGVDYAQGYHLGRPAPIEQHLAPPQRTTLSHR